VILICYLRICAKAAPQVISLKQVLMPPFTLVKIEKLLGEGD